MVGAAVIVTLAATLFASWAWGFTHQPRVAVRADLLDRHPGRRRDRRRREHPSPPAAWAAAASREIIPRAVDEVGGPTILATFTVIAALLPMAFVSGLMGPYMSPIPINASMGMLISLAVALIFTPWLCRVLLGHGARRCAARARAAAAEPGAAPVRAPAAARSSRPTAAARAGTSSTGASWRAIVFAVGLVAAKLVVLKMLPFDNKSEFQVVVDLPARHAPSETTARLLDELSHVIEQRARGQRLPGLRRHRRADQLQWAGAPVLPAAGPAPRRHPGQPRRQASSQPQEPRDRARACGRRWPRSARRYAASVQVVEVPPGPPVRAPIVAEIYGPRYAEQRQLAQGDPQAVRHDAATSSTSTTASKRPRHACWSTSTGRRPRCWASRQAQIVQTLSVGPAGLGRHLRARRSRALSDPGAPGAAGRRPREHRRSCWRSRCARPAGDRVPLSELVHVRTSAVGRRHLPQGPAAGGLRHRRHGRAARQSAVRHVRRCVGKHRARQPAGRGADCAALHQPAGRSQRAAPSSGTASGRSPTRPSATWASPTRWGWC